MSKKVFIGNVPFQAQDEELQQWFADHSIHPVGVAIVKHRVTGIFSINRGGDYGAPHEGLRLIVLARCWISSASEGICRAPLTRSWMY